jgi:hypothetical protein
MKRASYRKAVIWIALNDGSGDSWALEVGEVANQLTVVLVADLFGISADRVASDVVSYRQKQDR